MSMYSEPWCADMAVHSFFSCFCGSLDGLQMNLLFSFRYAVEIIVTFIFQDEKCLDV